jgi:hypothetical protein
MPTIGIELEFDGLAGGANKILSDRFGNKEFDDRSVRGDTFVADGVPIVPMVRNRKGYDRYIVPSGVGPSRAVGLESITKPMSEAEAYEFAEYVSIMFGHVPQTARSSIHIHMDVAGKSWRFVQNMLKICYLLEAPLYKLASGGVGKIHRGSRVNHDDGQYNDYRFVRPISNGIGVYFDSTLAPLVDPEALFSANSASAFIAAWGRLDYVMNDAEMRNSHYLPHRLHGFNLHSVLRQGTFEFRLFDAVYAKLPSMLDLVLAIYRNAESGKMPDCGHLPLGSKPYDITATWLSDYFGFDVGRLWSISDPWPEPTRQVRLNHYHDRSPLFLPTLEEVEVMSIKNNTGQRDVGGFEFSLYKRGK